MTNLIGILSDYARAQRNRAFGGVYALAGFDYQLRLYVAELAESLAGNGESLNEAGRVFLEALSDLTVQTEQGGLICIQAKRTLTSSTLKDAAVELLAIDQFLALEHPDVRDQVQFELIASQGDGRLQWASLPTDHPARSTVDMLLAQGRLRQPRFEADPGWRAIAAVWKHLKDPYGFVRFALDRALTRAPSSQDAMRIRDDICERFKQDCRSQALAGQILTPRDFHPDAHPGATLEIGREATLARMRDQQYMPRPHRLDGLYATLLERKDLSLRDLSSAARVFWVAGRSGVGKSVLLLQAVERLVADGRRVLWLGGHAELLEDVLRTSSDVPADLRPEFIAIDDLYDRDARMRIDLARIGDFIDEKGHQNWPLILTCGPTEFAQAFEEDSRYRGFEVYRETLQPIAEDEARKIEAWYRQRTGHASQRGPAFQQTSEAEGGLFVSLAVELAHGDLREFALRFADRVRANGLEDSLRLPLAINRLYLRAPYDWLTETDREKLATLNTEGDFRLLEAGEEGQIVRLTHPHLADALYRALRKPANADAYANDLVAIFRRTLSEGNIGLVTQLLRVFSTNTQGLARERLAIADEALLARQCAKTWQQAHARLPLDADGRADAATSWACWSARQPVIAETLQADLFSAALGSLEDAFKVWPGCWERLGESASHRSGLLEWAARHLSDPRRINHPAWSFVWERCLKQGAADHAAWRDIGLDWLQCQLRRPDWHFVWSKLLPGQNQSDWNQDPALILGMRRLKAESDGPDWAYVLQDLWACASPGSTQTKELAELAYGWLDGREDRAEWTYVWRVLLKHPEALPASVTLAGLVERGRGWLTGHENRAEWAHIWRVLLTHADEGPESPTLAGLLERGRGWLTGREDRAEWAHIWQDLLGYAKRLPASVTQADLLEQGHGWLDGREDRPEWNYIWQALLNHAEVFPASVTLVDLVERGHGWLAGREDRADWTHVWRELLGRDSPLRESATLVDLLERGRGWLAGREDRAEWVYVWRDLLSHERTLQEPATLVDLLERGRDWLDGREDRAGWAYVWQDVLGHGSTLPTSPMLVDLLERGRGWLAGREARLEWAHVWQDLLHHAAALPESITLASLFELGHHWLDGHENLVEWGFICEAALEYGYREPRFLETAAQWLIRSSDERAWPIFAAKFIVAAPRHPASSEFAAELVRRVHACANSRHWLKIEKTLLDGFAEAATTSDELQALQQTLANRHRAPVWDVARERMRTRTPVQGTVIAFKEPSCSVQLDNGLMAIWSLHRDRNRRSRGGTRDFFIVDVNPVKGFVQVSTEAPMSIEVGGIYEGEVTAQSNFGLFIKTGHMSGLLRRKKCADFPRVRATYGVGSAIRVEVLAIAEDGLELAYVDAEEKVDPISIGELHTGVVTGIKDYGVFVKLGKRSGLLHRQTLPPGTRIESAFSNGQEIQVRVVGIKEDGKLNLAPADFPDSAGQ